jgi:hypothetical protein
MLLGRRVNPGFKKVKGGLFIRLSKQRILNFHSALSPKFHFSKRNKILLRPVLLSLVERAGITRKDHFESTLRNVVSALIRTRPPKRYVSVRIPKALRQQNVRNFTSGKSLAVFSKLHKNVGTTSTRARQRVFFGVSKLFIARRKYGLLFIKKNINNFVRPVRFTPSSVAAGLRSALRQAKKRDNDNSILSRPLLSATTGARSSSLTVRLVTQSCYHFPSRQKLSQFYVRNALQRFSKKEKVFSNFLVEPSLRSGFGLFFYLRRLYRRGPRRYPSRFFLTAHFPPNRPSEFGAVRLWSNLFVYDR